MRPYELLRRTRIVRDNNVASTRHQYATKQKQPPPNASTVETAPTIKAPTQSYETYAYSRRNSLLPTTTMHTLTIPQNILQSAATFVQSVLWWALTESIIQIYTRDGKKRPPQRCYIVGNNIGVWQTRREFRYGTENISFCTVLCLYMARALLLYIHDIRSPTINILLCSHYYLLAKRQSAKFEAFVWHSIREWW